MHLWIKVKLNNISGQYACMLLLLNVSSLCSYRFSFSLFSSIRGSFFFQLSSCGFSICLESSQTSSPFLPSHFFYLLFIPLPFPPLFPFFPLPLPLFLSFHSFHLPVLPLSSMFIPFPFPSFSSSFSAFPYSFSYHLVKTHSYLKSQIEHFLFNAASLFSLQSVTLSGYLFS